MPPSGWRSAILWTAPPAAIAGEPAGGGSHSPFDGLPQRRRIRPGQIFGDPPEGDAVHDLDLAQPQMGVNGTESTARSSSLPASMKGI